MAAEVVEPKKKLNGDGSVSVEDVAKNPAVLKCQPQWEVFRATLLTRLRTVFDNYKDKQAPPLRIAQSIKATTPDINKVKSADSNLGDSDDDQPKDAKTAKEDKTPFSPPPPEAEAGTGDAGEHFPWPERDNQRKKDGVPKLPQSPTASVKNGSADHTVTRAATASNDEADIQSYQNIIITNLSNHGPPFTIQRICEILENPNSQYSNKATLTRALLKLVNVSLLHQLEQDDDDINESGPAAKRMKSA
eukprot:m.54076 g.54076  ORF g.54076 m.54076 type:complete len:248 (+) comp10897_c0_seq4:341-1084(+)